MEKERRAVLRASCIPIELVAARNLFSSLMRCCLIFPDASFQRERSGLNVSEIDRTSKLTLLAVLCRPMITRKIERGVDQGEMTQSLREIPEQPFICRIVTFGQEPDIVA